eukprot:CAMPEP_0172164994 /NCGR_PEP_ID=MMETSP1050-20130122/8163_1 /TAXON_ID=233186 /ORGANISM="Cryptomonas curvata, Strain CCAP979/52" /LENGTH=67 /DNA_ID=CAMNT_0012835411 /DNA_START=608 /DNA_END=808 /DNA_ORIENTATION=-
MDKIGQKIGQKTRNLEKYPVVPDGICDNTCPATVPARIMPFMNEKKATTKPQWKFENLPHLRNRLAL